MDKIKYNIQIMSKLECTLFSTKDLTEDYIVISINDTGCYTIIYPNPHIKEVLTLQFDDISEKEHEVEGLKLMNEYQANRIWCFINKHRNKVKNIIVHCTAGISRSGAIGCVLARYLNGDDNYLLATGKYIPNKHVYKLMCEAFGLEYSGKLFKEKIRIRNKGNQNNLKGYGDYGMDLDDMFCDIIIRRDINEN